MLVRCPGYCMASCKSCFEDVTSPVCVQSQFSRVSPGSASSTLSHCPGVLVAAELCFSGPCPPCPAWWRQWLLLRFSLSGISFVGALLWEGSWSVLCLSTFLGWLSAVALALLLLWLGLAGWWHIPKTWHSWSHPQLGQNLSVCAAQTELGERQAV